MTGDENQRNSDKPIGISFPSLKRHKELPKSQAFSKSNSVQCFLNFYENNWKRNLKSYLNFGSLITPTQNKRKLRDLAILPNDFVNDQKEYFFYLQWPLALIYYV